MTHMKIIMNFFFYYIINLDVSDVNFDYCNEFILKDRDIGVVWVNSNNKNNGGKIAKLSEDWILIIFKENSQALQKYKNDKN